MKPSFDGLTKRWLKTSFFGLTLVNILSPLIDQSIKQIVFLSHMTVTHLKMINEAKLTSNP